MRHKSGTVHLVTGHWFGYYKQTMYAAITFWSIFSNNKMHELMKFILNDNEYNSVNYTGYIFVFKVAESSTTKPVTRVNYLKLKIHTLSIDVWFVTMDDIWLRYNYWKISQNIEKIIFNVVIQRCCMIFGIKRTKCVVNVLK